MKEFNIKFVYDTHTTKSIIRCPTWSALYKILLGYKGLNFKYVEIERRK